MKLVDPVPDFKSVMAESASIESGVIVQVISEEKGRGLVATRDFVKGETLFREKPMVSSQFSWNAEYGYRACHNCMEPLETAQENVIRLSGNPNLLLPHTDCCSTRLGNVVISLAFLGSSVLIFDLVVSYFASLLP